MRVVVDEGIGGTSPLWQQFQAWLGGRDAEVVWLSEAYPAMPDVEILAKLLTPDTILLTRDGVLHNRVLSQGLRSFTRNPQGQLTHKPLSLKGKWATPLPPSVLKTIQASYQHDPHPIALALSAGLPPRTLKAYRTKRRRIRSYFGSQANMARAAWTVGARLHQGHLLCGYALRIESVHGVKGLRASEAYGLDPALPPDPAQCLVHALLDVFHLHLESLRHEFFVIPTDAYELARQMVDPAGPEPSCAIHRVLRALLQALPHKAMSPCSQGWFHEQMQRKLAHLTASPGHEIVRLEVRDVVRRLGDRGRPRHKARRGRGLHVFCDIPEHQGHLWPGRTGPCPAPTARAAYRAVGCHPPTRRANAGCLPVRGWTRPILTPCHAVAIMTTMVRIP